MPSVIIVGVISGRRGTGDAAGVRQAGHTGGGRGGYSVREALMQPADNAPTEAQLTTN